MPLDQAKKVYNETKDFALLYIPQIDINKPEGIAIYTKENPSIEKVGDLESSIENQIHDLKLKEYNIDEATLKSLRPKVNLKQFNLSDTGEEKSSSAGILYGLDLVSAF
jgi:ABC-2 type transport system permease protein